MSSPAYFLLSLAFAAHLVGDFVVQTEAVVRGKQNSNRILLWHITEHILAMLALFGLGRLILGRIPGFPPPSPAELGALIAGVALTHLVIDKLKILLDRRRGGSAASYVIDQILHLLILGAGTAWVAARHPEWSELASTTIPLAGRSLGLTSIATGVLVVASYVFALRAGAIFVWMITRPLTQDCDDHELEAQGISRYPLRDMRALLGGYAERFLGLSCVLLGSIPGLIAVYAGRSLLAARETIRKTDAPLLSHYRVLEILGGLSTVVAVGVTVRFLLP